MPSKKKPGDSPKSNVNRNRNPKVGSNPGDAKTPGSADDFGIPAREAMPHDLRPHNPDKPSVDDQADDHRGISGKGAGQRTHGAGSSGRGKPGSGSGGDVDTDLTGVGTGGGTVAASGDVNQPPGPDDTDGSSRAFASGPPAQGESKVPRGAVGGSIRVTGSVNDRGDRQDGIDGPPVNSGSGIGGADAAGNAEGGAPGDDASAGEISIDEATGGA